MSKKQATGRWLALALALCALSGCDVQSANADPSGAPYSTSPPASDVVGDLGGVPVSIPRAYARLVEYEGDPHWLEKRKGPPPVRTFESKLTSFGIVARYPDMTPLANERYSNYQENSLRGREWIDMGVSAGVNLNIRDEEFERPYESKVPGHEVHPSNVYERLPMIHGLTPYKAVKDLGINVVLDEENRDHSGLNHVLYFGRDDSGRIISVIRCRSGLTTAPGGTRTCRQRFSLGPEMKAEAQLVYDDDLLPHWREYQARYRDLLLGFRVIRPAVPRLAFKP